jgi:hypothetical protein
MCLYASVSDRHGLLSTWEHYDRSMRPAPHRIERLPQQYFSALLAQLSHYAALDGEPLVDLGRGNP